MTITQLLIHWALSAFALILTAYLVRGFKVKNFGVALLATLIIEVANALVWSSLISFELPINLFTLGILAFVVNVIMLRLCAAILPGFELKTWLAGIFGAIILALVSLVLHVIVMKGLLLAS